MDAPKKIITEDYVSFETAKLLKEKGFGDEYTNAFYDKNGNLYFIDLLSDFSEHPDNDTDIAASTLYVAMKWLREIHNIHIEIMQMCNLDEEHKWYSYYAFSVHLTVLPYTKIAEDEITEYKTYEQVCEAAIKCCLENFI